VSRRLPLVPTLAVAAAVLVMIGLGVWQIQRASWKAELLDKYEAAEKLPPISWPTVPVAKANLPFFRHATGVCLRPVGKRAIAGENAKGDPGYAQIVDCSTGAEGPGMAVEVGWSQDPNAKFTWNGGPVSGIIVPDRRSQIRLVAATAPPGLESSRVPDVSSASPITPAVHHGYAATWFGLALVALVIYALALRKRWRQAKP
jgi:surfeit locus 1 family protein